MILQEIGAVEDTPDDLVFDLFNAAAFPEQPIGSPILGTPEHVRAFDRSMIAAYLESHYRSSATTIGAAGAVDHAQVVDAAEKAFANLPVHAAEATVPARYLGGEKRAKRRLEQAHVVIGFEGVAYSNSAHYALQVFANAIGGGMSSRLFQEVREKRGLAYSINAFHWGYSDTGLFGFYAATGKRQVRELHAGRARLPRRSREGSERAEVQRAKAQMKVSLLAALRIADRARRTDRPADPRFRPGSDARRNHRKDRLSDGRGDPRRGNGGAAR